MPSSRRAAAKSGPPADESRLDAALRKLARAFGPRRDRIAPIQACSHCFDPEQLTALAGPVDAIPDDLFYRALWKWGTTMDENVVLWRRLTPRILQELATGTLHIDETLIARKFGQAGWQTWPEDEQHAVSEFCEGWFEAALANPDGPTTTEVLPFVAVMFQRVGHWLERWSATTGRRADEQLAHLARWWLRDLITGSLDVSFSGDLPGIAPELTAWLVAEAPVRLRDGDLSADDAYCLSQLALPEEQRWR